MRMFDEGEIRKWYCAFEKYTKLRGMEVFRRDCLRLRKYDAKVLRVYVHCTGIMRRLWVAIIDNPRICSFFQEGNFFFPLTSSLEFAMQVPGLHVKYCYFLSNGVILMHTIYANREIVRSVLENAVSNSISINLFKIVLYKIELGKAMYRRRRRVNLWERGSRKL